MTNMKKSKAKVVRIFSGDASRKLWDEINNAKTIGQLRDALYSLGCKLQELESLVRK